MKVKEFIEILNEYDSEAQFEVVLNGCPKVFGFAYGTSEGCTKKNCDTVWLEINTYESKERIIDE